MYTVTIRGNDRARVHRARLVTTEGSTPNFRLFVLTDGVDCDGEPFYKLSLCPGVDSDVEVKE